MIAAIYARLNTAVDGRSKHASRSAVQPGAGTGGAPGSGTARHSSRGASMNCHHFQHFNHAPVMERKG